MSRWAQNFVVTAAMEFAAVHIVLNRGQQIALAVKGDNDVHLFGHYLAYHKPPSDLTGAVQARPSTGARPHSRLSQGSSVSASFCHDQPPLHFQGSQLSSTKRRREENGDYVEEEDAAPPAHVASDVLPPSRQRFPTWRNRAIMRYSISVFRAIRLGFGTSHTELVRVIERLRRDGEVWVGLGEREEWNSGLNDAGTMRTC
ncbi:hypothetical protein B0H11DRAFT_2251899 [Mycena galericulata]|nr:hypothetical protein B0H11DRAFT_2251899 [Mycena galericulata]